MQHFYRTFSSILLVLALMAFVPAGAQVILTRAGNGTVGTTDGQDTVASMNTPYGVAVDKAGNIYFADTYNNSIRMVSTAGIVTTIAGTAGTSGFSGDGSAATNATLSNPEGIALDDSNNIYIADNGNNCIRKVYNKTGIIVTIANVTGNKGYGGDDSLATSTSVFLNGPTGIAIDKAGNVYFSDANNYIVRKINKATGIITTVVGLPGNGYNYASAGVDTANSLAYPQGLALDNLGNLYIADNELNGIFKVNFTTDSIYYVVGNVFTEGYGTVPTLGTNVNMYGVWGLAADTLGNLYFSNNYNNYIYRLNKHDSVFVYAGNGYGGYSGDNVMANTAEINSPYGLALDDSLNLYFADQANNRIREARIAGPNITVQPPSYQSACIGMPATVGIVVTGTGVTYQWQADSSGQGWKNIPNAGTYSNANTDTLHIATITSYSPGVEYQCIINNGYITTTTDQVGSISTPSLYFGQMNNYNSYTDSVCPGSWSNIYIQDNYGGPVSCKWNFKGLGSNNGVTGDTVNLYAEYTTTFNVAVQTIGCVIDTTFIQPVFKRTLKIHAFPGAVVCKGQNVTLYATGGTDYQWQNSYNNYSTLYSFQADTSGMYTVSGSIAGGYYGCGDSANYYVKVNPTPTVIATSTKDSICIGSSVILNGGGALTYDWSGDVTNGVAFTPTASAIYYLTGTDVNGCSNTTSVPVVVNTLPVVTGTASPNAVCKGATVTLSGNGAASYTWNGGAVNSVAFVPASSGSYTVTGTDAHGCVNTAAVTITVDPLPTVSASAFPSAKLCQGSSLALFGAGAASYAWTGGVNNGVSFTPSASVSYTVTGIDANGCINKDSISVIVHHKVVPTVSSANTTCGLQNGSASVAASNGIAPYSYSWSTNPASSNSFVDSLAAGTYVVTVSDSANCASSAAVSIGSSTSPVLSVATTNSNCGVVGTGSADVTVSGGTAPYRYIWNNGDTLATNYNLKAATYIITVTDINGCSSFAPAIVTNLNGPKITTLSITNVKCNGLATGAISVSVSGGIAPYHYLWSTGATTSAISSLFAGPYQLTVFDADTCTSVENFTLTQPVALSVASSTVKADCGISNGSASISVTGGVAPFTYKWSTGATSNSIAAVAAGVYYVAVTDDNGCPDSSLVSVSDKTGPALDINLTANASCHSGGVVSVSASGGTLPYTYKWNNGVTASSIANVPAGNYYVNVTDGKGCVSSADTTVSEMIPPAISLCMVTVDPVGGLRNYIIWDKSLAKNIKQYNIYKESTQAGVYFKIDSVPIDSAGVYVDLFSDATVRSWRYKLSQVDSCGNESPLSPAHKTIHLTVNQGLTGYVNLIWDNYEGLNFNTYYVYRDTNAKYFTLIDSIPNNIFTYTDKSPLSTAKPVIYRIGISNPGGCTPAIQAVNYNAAKSNSGNYTLNTASIPTVTANSGSINIFPNPSTGVFTVALSLDKPSRNLTLSVVNTLGQVITSSSFNDVQVDFTKQLDLSSIAKGVYFIKTTTDHSTFYNKIVIQ